ncbi:MAG: hypothetical protein OEZ58_00135 [Gammaproteobacteria bacterium]|nr:hypothetical protein [Gammaproteobacteria bacterium]
MKILVASPKSFIENGTIKNDLVEVFTVFRNKNNIVAVLSNHPEPEWYEQHVGRYGVQFFQVKGRQSGEHLIFNANNNNLQPYDVFVLAGSVDDIAMAKNSGAILIAANWSNEQRVRNLGIQVSSAEELQQLIELVTEWKGNWWYNYNDSQFRIKALTNLSSYGKHIDQQAFSSSVTSTIKNGGNLLNSLLTVTSQSLLVDNYNKEENLLWGVYPSSASSNNDSEVLSDFTHRLRTTVSNVRFAKRGQPLFIRHTVSPKRSAGQSVDRTNPASQIITMNLNPFYKNRIVGKHVVVLDDCTTYGLSFGVADALLKKAGAKMVTGIALGKYGNQAHKYSIEIKSDPFRPITMSDVVLVTPHRINGTESPISQSVLQKIIVV